MKDHQKVFASPVQTGTIVPGTKVDGNFDAIWIGGAGSGNLKVTKTDGTDQVFAGVLAGAWFPIVAHTVVTSGTDVTNMVWGRW